MNKNIAIFQGIFQPFPTFQDFYTCLKNSELIDYIDPATMDKYKNNKLETLYDQAQIIHAINIFKYNDIFRKGQNIIFNQFSGFSMGIYSAICASGNLSISDSSKLIKERAYLFDEYMRDKEFDMYAISSAKENALELVKDLDFFGNNLHISTISTNRHFTVAIQRSFVSKLIDKAGILGLTKFDKIFQNAAWHTPVLKGCLKEFTNIIDNYCFSDLDNMIFSQNSKKSNIKDALLLDSYQCVDWRIVTKHLAESNMFSYLIDETGSFEKIMLSQKNNFFRTVTCAG